MLFSVAEVAIYVQAHTDNGPIFSPPWSPAHPIIRAEVVEEQDPGIIFLTLQVTILSYRNIFVCYALKLNIRLILGSRSCYWSSYITF